MSDPPLWTTAAAAALALLLLLTTAPASAAPMQEHQQIQHQLDEYYGGLAASGCYYNFVHYEEGDRIMTNEPCLNCTCHNRMLMCYLRVCPFSKGIGQDCTVEQRPDQCCPVITCPEVPVQLVTSSTTITTPPAPTGSTAVGHPDNYGCTIDELFYSDGTKIPGDPTKPCELCYCIRNHTACVMQECTLHVEGCRPVYAEGVCCPVRYDCDYQDYTTAAPLLETTLRPTPGLLFTTTMAGPLDCRYGDEMYADGALIETEEPCQHCYCMRGDIVCAVQECGTPLEREAGNCTALPPQPGQCCPQQYQCDNGTIPFDIPSQETEMGQTSKSTVSLGSSKSDQLLPVSTEATVAQQAQKGEEQEVQHQTTAEETQQHLNEIDQDSEQHTHYEDEEHEKEAEIQHIIHPVEQDQEDTIEQITQTIEQFPQHSEQGSSPGTLESESSVTESVVASSEKQGTMLGSISTATESITEKEQEIGFTEDETAVEQVTQKETISSSSESIGDGVHDEQSATFVTDKVLMAVTTVSTEKDGEQELSQQGVSVSSTPSQAETGISSSSDEPSIHVTEINSSEAMKTDIPKQPTSQSPVSVENEVSAVISESDLGEQLTTELNEPGAVTVMEEINTPESNAATEKPNENVEENVTPIMDITAEKHSTEKVEFQDFTTASPISPEISNGNENIPTITEIQFLPDKTEEPVISEQSETDKVELHETNSQIYEDAQVITTPTNTEVKPETDQSGLVIPEVNTEEETVTEDLNQSSVDSDNQISGNENEGGQVTHGPHADISSAEDKIDEQSVTQAIIVEDSVSTSSEQSINVHETELSASSKPLEQTVNLPDELHLSTETENLYHTTHKPDEGDSSTIISEPITMLNHDKQEDNNWKVTEVPFSEDIDNELESSTKTDETQHTTVIHDNDFTPNEFTSAAEGNPEDSHTVEESVLQGETGITNNPLPNISEEQQTGKPESATSSNVESTTHRVPVEDVSKPNAEAETIHTETGEEAQGSAQVTNSNDIIGTSPENTKHTVTTPTEFKPASEAVTSEELLTTPKPQQPVIFDEVVSESPSNTTEDSIHHLVSEMNGKPTEIHTTPSETVSSSHSSEDDSSVGSGELEQEGSGSTESLPPKEPVVVQEQTGVEQIPEHETPQGSATVEDKELTTEFVPPGEHGFESASPESSNDHKLQIPVKHEENPETLELTTTEQSLPQAAEEQTYQKPNENVDASSSLAGSHVITTPGIDKIEAESVQQAQKPFEMEDNKEVMEGEVLPSEFSEATTKAVKEEQPQKPVEDGAQQSIEVSGEATTTVTLTQEAAEHHESQETSNPEKPPSSFPLTTEGIGGFVQELSTASPVQGPVGISTNEPQHAVIPGEGNCLVDGRTYVNNSEIPPPSPCHVSCLCISSIVHCVSVNCPPPPTHLENCTPVRHSDDACCPTYTCDVKHEVTLVADNHMAGTEEPIISGEGSITYEEEHKETIKPETMEESSLLHTNQGSDTSTEYHPFHQSTEIIEHENAGSSAHDSSGSEKPITISSDEQEHAPASSGQTETQTSHLPSTEKPSDDHIQQQEEKGQQTSEVQHEVKPEDSIAAEHQTPSSIEPQPTEAAIQEGTDTLGHTISSINQATSDKNEGVYLTTQNAPGSLAQITTISVGGISDQSTKEEHTQSSVEVAEHITVSASELSTSSGDVPALASDTEEGREPSIIVTGDVDHAEVSTFSADEFSTEQFTESVEHVTHPVLATVAAEESIDGDQFSQTLVSSTEGVQLSSEHTAVTEAEGISNEQFPAENDSEDKMPSVTISEHDQHTVTIIHSEVPSVAPPESDSQSKYPTTSSEHIKPEQFDKDHTINLPTEKPVPPDSEDSGNKPNETGVDEQQASVSPIYELSSEESLDHTQEIGHPTDIPSIQTTETTIPLHETEESSATEGSGHEEAILTDITDKVEQQETYFPETMENHHETVSQDSFPTAEQVTSVTESKDQQELISTEAVMQSGGEEGTGAEPTISPTYVVTEHSDISQRPFSEEDVHESGSAHTLSPTDSSSQSVAVTEAHIFEGGAMVTEEQPPASGETDIEPTPQHPSASEENGSGVQLVTSPVGNEDDKFLTQQEEHTEIHQQDLLTSSPVDDHEQAVEQSTGKKPTEEDKTQLLVEEDITSISQNPISESEEETTEAAPENLQTPVAVETAVAQQTDESQHYHETDEVSSTVGTKIEEETISLAAVDVEPTAIPEKPALPGSEASNETEQGEGETLSSEDEQQTIIPQSSTQSVSQQEPVNGNEEAAGSITGTYVEQKTTSIAETDLQHTTVSQQPISDVHKETTVSVSHSHPGHTSVPPQLASLDEEGVTTTDEQTIVSLDTDTKPGDSHEVSIPLEEDANTVYTPNEQEIVPSSEDSDQHVSVSQEHISVTAEPASQSISPEYEDKIITSEGVITTENLMHEIDKQTILPMEQDIEQERVTLGALPIEDAENQTIFTTVTEKDESTITQKPTRGGEQTSGFLESAEVGTVLPVEVETEPNTIFQQGLPIGDEVITSTESSEIMTAKPVNADTPSQITTGEEKTETVIDSDKQHTLPPITNDLEQIHSSVPAVPSGQEGTTELSDTSVPALSEVMLSSTAPAVGVDEEIQQTGIPPENELGAESSMHEAGKPETTLHEDSQTVVPQQSVSAVDTESSEEESEKSKTTSLPETDSHQIMTTPQPIVSSEGIPNLEGTEIQQSSVPSETGIQLTSTSLLPGQEASITEETGSQQTVSVTEDTAQTLVVHQPISESEAVPETSATSEVDIQHSLATELPGTSVEIAVPEAQQPVLHEEETTSEETLAQTSSPIEIDVQQTVVTEGLSEELTTTNKVSSLIPSRPDEQSLVSHVTEISEEHHIAEAGGVTDVSAETELQVSTSKVPVVTQNEHSGTEALGQPEAVEESGTAVQAVDYPPQAAIGSGEHHIEISEQSSQENVTSHAVTQQEEDLHPTGPSLQLPVELPVSGSEEQVSIKPAETSEVNQIHEHVEDVTSLHSLHSTEISTQSPEHVGSSQTHTEQEGELQTPSSSTILPSQQSQYSSTSHPSIEKFPEDHTLAAGEGIEHITEGTKHPPQHFVTKPPLTTGSHHHPTQHPEEQYEQFPFGEGQYPTGADTDYDDEEHAAFGPGTCRYGGKVYVSAQQIPRDDPCDFCFCFRSDIICLQQSCPPPIPGCHEEPIQGFCCPRYECPVSMATVLNISTTTTTTTTTLPPHFLAHHYKGAARRTGCQVQGTAYHVGEVVHSASGPCLECRCGGDGQMKCDPKECSPEPMLRKMIMAAASRRR